MKTPLRIAARGASIATSASSASVAIPDMAAGFSPSAIRLAATAACYARLGKPSEVSAVPSAAGTGYVPGDTITLTGGTFASAMKLLVTNTKLISAAVNAAGTGYDIADTITAAGGTAATKAILAVATTKVVSATVDNPGSGGTPGAATVTGTTGTGTKFQAAVTIAGDGTISSVNSISVAGNYTVNPTDIAHEPVTGGSLSGAQLAIVIGVRTVTVSNAGDYTANAASFTQFATSGGGSGATFNTLVYGVKTVSVSDPGTYTADPSNPVSQGSTTGSGAGATFTATMVTAAAAGDLLVMPEEAVIVDARGYDHVAAIRVSADGVLQISPIEE
jgi:hypothetical protein